MIVGGGSDMFLDVLWWCCGVLNGIDEWFSVDMIVVVKDVGV